MNVKNCISVFRLLLLLTLGACKNAPTERTFLIPSNYQGTLRIIYGEKCGVQPKEENGREIVEFQKNGLAILNTENDFKIKNEFYLADDKGKRTKVNEISAFEDRITRMPAILAGGETVSTSVVNYENSKSTLSGGADCVDYYLYNTNTTKIEEAHLSERLDSLTNSVVNACRENK